MFDCQNHSTTAVATKLTGEWGDDFAPKAAPAITTMREKIETKGIPALELLL